jgi:hypothetical protein
MPPGWLELRNEFALRAALQKKYAQEANKLPYSEVKPMPTITEADIERMRREMQIDDQGRVVTPSNNFGEPRRFGAGGSNTIDVDELMRERAPSSPERFNRHIAPHIQRGLDSMFPIRQILQRSFENNVFNPISEAVLSDPRTMLKNAHMAQNSADSGKYHMENAARSAIGMQRLPDEPFDPAKELGDINTGEFDRQYVDMDKNHARLLEALRKRQAMGKAEGGEVRMQAGGVLNRMKSAAKNMAGNQGLSAALMEEDPMAYAGGIGSLFALYHGKLNEDEIEMDRNRRLNAEMQRAGFTRNPNDINPAYKNPLPQFNPQEIIANYPNWADMPPVDKARVLKNYEDYKRMAPSGHRYGGGGGVKKQAVDLARRGFMGLRGAAPVEHLPAVVQPTTKSVLDAPVSRRSVLQSGVGQLARGVLPMGEMLPGVAKVVNAVQQAAEIAVPRTVTEAMVPGLVAEGLKNGYSFPRIMKMVEGELGTGMRNINEADIERMYENLRDPYSATDMGMFPNRTTAGDAYRSMTGVEGAFGSPLRQLRESMRSVREADPDLHEILKGLSRDIEHYGYE